MNTNRRTRALRRIGNNQHRSFVAVGLPQSFRDSDSTAENNRPCTFVSIRVNSWLLLVGGHFRQLRRKQAFLFFLVQRQPGRHNGKALRFIHNHFGRRLIHFELGARFLDLRRLLFKLRCERIDLLL